VIRACISCVVEEHRCHFAWFDARRTGTRRERIGEDERPRPERHRARTAPGAIGEDAQAAPNPKSKLPVRKRNRQYGGHDAEIAAMAPGAEAAAALSHFGTAFGSPPGVPGGGMTGIAPPSRGGAAIFGSTPEGGQMTPFD
jgi:hypothetical protein